MKYILSLILIFSIYSVTCAQSSGTEVMDHTIWDIWRTISDENISPDGAWIHYTTSTHDGDPTTHLYHVSSQRTILFERAENGQLVGDNLAFVFAIKPPAEEVKALERKKTKKSEMPKDSLGIYYLSSQSLVKKPNLHSFKIPEKGGNAFAYQVVDTNETKKPKAHDLIIHHVDAQVEDTLPHISKYTFSEKGNQLAAIQLNKDSTLLDGIWVYTPSNRTPVHVLQSKGKYSNLTWDEDGQQLAFVADLDTTKNKHRPFSIFHWSDGDDFADEIMSSFDSFLPESHFLSDNYQPDFSKDGSQLLFGIAPKAKLQDTTLLDDEIVSVEIWTYEDDLLYTQQEARLERQKKMTYRGIYHFDSNQALILNDQSMPEIALPTRDSESYHYALASNPTPYQKLISWEGTDYRDIYLVNVHTGKKELVQKKVDSRAQFSPGQKYVYWYQRNDTAWYAYSIDKGQIIQLTNNSLGTFYDEINDRPMHPSPYRSAGWTEDDENFLVYDRYDIWRISPNNLDGSQPITSGREDKTVYRYIRLDPEKQSLNLGTNWLLSTFDEKSKSSGYAQFDARTNSIRELIDTPHRYGNLTKAKEADVIYFTRQNFRTFPDLQVSNTTFSNITQVSNANPQQDDYRWGDIELYEWVSSDGIDLEGMLIKPDNFDPSKKYPLMVYFYEKSSDRLHSYPTMSPGRSSINYAYYANQGYVIFNPDIPYKVGWPGESAYNAVISGVTALIQEGFIDKSKIGVQGHSWGGYQIAHLITRSNIFACAESGAPVVNMFSAYGGIRWGSGMSRMFQYEHTQSRIGGTIWDKTIRYMNNSPLFFVDKIETPVLILHNDDDTAVPWYQGIEFFVSLRRLNKPAWLLNYNGEPHGITKWQNRVDFQRRMSQFFDHYLLDKPMPIWMSKGVPAIEKSITTGFNMEPVDHNR